MGTPIQTMTVSILDETNKPLTVSRVEAVSASTVILTPGPGGVPRVNLGSLSEGPFKIRMTFPDRPMFELPFIVKKVNSELLVNYVGDRPMCCSLTRQKIGETGKWTELRFNLAIKLSKKHKEVIFIAGWDYEGKKNDFALYCNTYRDDLFNGITYRTGVKKNIDKRIDEGTLVTLFDFKTGKRTYYLKNIKNWTIAGVHENGRVPTYLGIDAEDVLNGPCAQKRHADDSISITHVYNYMTYLGNTAPKSVKEFHIFSHSSAPGPILVNTWQDPIYTGGNSREGERDPGDKDCRSKDFSLKNMPRLSDFRNVFSADATVKVWGCMANDYREVIKAAAKAKSDSEVLKPFRMGDMLYSNVTRGQAKNAIRRDFIKKSYTGVFKDAIGGGGSFYGAPPGLGAAYKQYHGGYYMIIPVKNDYRLERKWLETELGLKFDDTSYLLY